MRMTRSNRLRAAVLAMALAQGYAFAADAQFIDVPAGDLTVALETLAAQSGVELFYRPEQFEGRRTNGVRGSLTAEQAAKALVAGMGLTVRVDPSGLLVISKASPEGRDADVSSSTQSTDDLQG